MAFEFKLPDIGEGIHEGEIVKWLVSEGDSVKEDQPIVEVMTDKATVEITAPRTGTIGSIKAKEGEVVTVGSVMVTIEEGGGGKAASKPSGGAKKEAKASVEEEKEEPKATREEKEEPKEEKTLFDLPPDAVGVRRKRKEKEVEVSGGGNGQAATPSGRVLATPSTRKFAREKGVDLQAISGSGPRGRVTREDVEAAASGKRERTVTVSRPPTSLPKREREERVPVKGLRRAIAKTMTRSHAHVVPFTYVDEVDCTQLVALRESAKPIAQEKGVKLTYLPFIVKAVVAALKQYGIVNSSYDEESNEIVLKNYYHVGIAVQTDQGLTVPVVKDADTKNVFELAAEMEELSDKARSGKAKLDELTGSTFTITSLGKTGGVLATPVVNYPETAIMGVHEMKDRAVVKDGKVVPGKLMNLSFTFDHRIIDGAIGAEFAQAIIRFIEDPKLLLLETV